jgi:hypothetical protein
MAIEGEEENDSRGFVSAMVRATLASSASRTHMTLRVSLSSAGEQPELVQGHERASGQQRAVGGQPTTMYARPLALILILVLISACATVASSLSVFNIYLFSIYVKQHY